MILSNNNGDHDVSSCSEIETLFGKDNGDLLDDIWLYGDDEYPSLAILINGKYACVHYFKNDQGDMWQSVGNAPHEVTFMSNGESSPMPANAVIALEDAIECAKQFFKEQKRPDCIEWREL